MKNPISKDSPASHVRSETPLLYFGTPVVLISTVNEDGSYNLAPMSSAFWLGWRAILGLDVTSKTTANMIRTGECVLNLPSDSGVAAVDRLARLTGSHPVPPMKVVRGYTHERGKFEIAGLTPIPSETVSPPRALECPVQLEAVITARRDLAEEDDVIRGAVQIFEVRIQRVHLDRSILMNDNPHRIDPDKWRPLIMSFQKFYGLTSEQVHGSKLGEIAEETYRSPDTDRARGCGAKL
jgi:flavin reductase (DIM6/NTAB) family NADH-FMN oxidoreductase RutF